jgi:hypothetical protein
MVVVRVPRVVATVFWEAATTDVTAATAADAQAEPLSRSGGDDENDQDEADVHRESRLNI